MEIKKSKKASLQGMRSINLLMGLIVALAIMFFVFEFTQFKTKIIEPVVKVTYLPTEEEIVPITQPVITAAPPPPADIPPVAEIIEIVENDVEIEEKEIETTESENTAIAGPSANVTPGPVVAAVGSGPPGPPVEVTVATPPPPPPPAPEPVVEEEKTDDNEIFEVAEVQPQFPGGMDALMQYLQKNIKYPSRAQENNIKGTVVVRFVVGKDGSVSNTVVAKSLDPDCDREAVRVISNMPRWSPGKQSGKPVNCYFTVPVRFVLQ